MITTRRLFSFYNQFHWIIVTISYKEKSLLSSGRYLYTNTLCVIFSQSFHINYHITLINITHYKLHGITPSQNCLWPYWIMCLSRSESWHENKRISLSSRYHENFASTWSRRYQSRGYMLRITYEDLHLLL